MAPQLHLLHEVYVEGLLLYACTIAMEKVVAPAATIHVRAWTGPP